MNMTTFPSPTYSKVRQRRSDQVTINSPDSPDNNNHTNKQITRSSLRNPVLRINGERLKSKKKYTVLENQNTPTGNREHLKSFHLMFKASYKALDTPIRLIAADCFTGTSYAVKENQISKPKIIVSSRQIKKMNTAREPKKKDRYTTIGKCVTEPANEMIPEEENPGRSSKNQNQNYLLKVTKMDPIKNSNFQDKIWLNTELNNEDELVVFRKKKLSPREMARPFSSRMERKYLRTVVTEENQSPKPSKKEEPKHTQTKVIDLDLVKIRNRDKPGRVTKRVPNFNDLEKWSVASSEQLF